MLCVRIGLAEIVSKEGYGIEFAFDGGQLAVVLIEAAGCCCIDQRVQEGMNAGTLFILMIISFGTAVGDVTLIF